MRKWFSLLLLLAASGTNAQDKLVQDIKGLPTEEVYDIFCDSKGFIWVGHSLGLSRYDGRTFRHFNSTEQTGLGVSRLCEDWQGRIWCHNFNGQIFYVEQEQMHLLKDYDPSLEANFPDITVLDSEFIATSARGLFVCNTYTMKGRFLYTPGARTGTQTLCPVRGSLIIYDNRSALAFRYQPGSGLQPLVVNDSLLGMHRPNKALIFSTSDKNGYIYGYDNEKSMVFKMQVVNDTLTTLQSSKAPGVINTIVNCRDTIWVNTKQRSYVLGTQARDTISGGNLTDLVVDKAGNRWISSLQTGLQLQPQYRGWQRKLISFIGPDDFIRCMVNWQGHLLYGTQSGKIILVTNGRPARTLQLPARAGSVENFFILPNKQVVVAPSLGLYLADLEDNRLYPLSEIATAKTLAITDTTILIGYAQTLAKISLYPELKNKLLHTDARKGFDQLFRNAVKLEEKYLVDTRCFYIDYNKRSRETFALVKTGLLHIMNDRIVPILFENKPIRSVSLIQSDSGTLFIGTLSAGLLVKEGDLFRHITTEEGLSSNTILKMKLFGTRLVLIEPGYVQIWDAVTRDFTATITLPKDKSGTVYDFLVDNGRVYVNLTNSMYELDLDDLSHTPPVQAYIMSAVSTRSNTNIENGAELDYNDNSIQIQLASPGYINSEATYFQYSLLGAGDQTTYRLLPPYTLSFVSLKPGRYRLTAQAVNFQGQGSDKKIFEFTINKPLWQRSWFYVLTAALAAWLLYLLFQIRHRSIKRRNDLMIEKLTLQSELRKSLLKTIVTQMNPHFIFNAMNTIQGYVYQGEKQNVSNYMGKFSELIRKILDTSNADFVSLEEEITIIRLYLDLEKARFEDNFNASVTVDEEVDTETLSVPPMFIQPYVENAIKHGLFHKKTNRRLLVTVCFDGDTKEYLRITVDDNGIGRTKSMEINSQTDKKHKSFATSALENRVNLINQTILKKISIVTVDKPDHTGTTVIIRLPVLNEKLYDQDTYH